MSLKFSELKKGATYSREPHSRNAIYHVSYMVKCDFCKRPRFFKKLWSYFMHSCNDHKNEFGFKEAIMKHADKIIRGKT